MNLNELRDKVHANAVEKGFWDEPLSDSHYLMLVITELSEAVEADRKGKYAKVDSFNKEMDGCLGIGWKEDSAGYNDVFQKYFSMLIKDSVEDELSDAFILLLSFAGYKNIDIEDFTEEDIEDLSESCNGESFTESIYAISTLPIMAKCGYGYQLDKQLNCMLVGIWGFAKHLNINLSWHVKQKMKYNQLRERLHGKKY